MKTKLLILISVAFALHAYAGSATWNLNPTSGDWNTAANWTPATVPNGANDIATFASSNNTAVSLSTSVEVNAITFNAGATGFNITSTPQFPLTISGTGVTNNSDTTQTFIIDQDDSADSDGITFNHTASAGTATAFIVKGGEDFAFGTGGTLIFRDTATAENGTFEVFGAKAGAFRGGTINFWDSSSAGNATFTIHPGGNLNFANTATLANGKITNRRGQLYFLNDASGGDGTIINSAPFPTGGVFFNSASTGNVTVINNGATSTSTSGYCSVSLSADTGTFINNGGTGSGAAGGITAFVGGGANGANSTLIARGGTDGGSGGQITFSESSDGGMARVKVSGNGALDISDHNLAGVTIGSLEGDGSVRLGTENLNLTVGSNDLSTTFSGIIQDTGSLKKIGLGRLTLTGANTYSGFTRIDGGILEVNNRSGSGTGSGPVFVNGGTLAGQGTIAGVVTEGPSGGPRGVIDPGRTAVRPRTLTIQSLVSFTDGSYHCDLNSNKSSADSIAAGGVQIVNTAVITLADAGTTSLPAGTVFTIIDNTSATAIDGTFSNLADGGTVTVGSNTFQANYEGGDGNDLTLTVVP